MSYSYRGGAEGWTPRNKSALEQDLEASPAAGDDSGSANRKWIDLLSSLKFLRWVNLGTYLANVAVTYGIGMIGSGGVFGVELETNADVSSKFQTLVTPVGWSFAVIWSFIFASQAAWVGRQFFIKAGGDSTGEKAVKAVGYRYLTTVICQAAWTVNFGMEAIIIAFLIMLIIWINQNSPSAVRATMISMYWQSNALGQIIGSPILGWVGTAVSVRASLTASGVIHAFVLLFVRVGTRKENEVK